VHNPIQPPRQFVFLLFNNKFIISCISFSFGIFKLSKALFVLKGDIYIPSISPLKNNKISIKRPICSTVMGLLLIAKSSI
jgi:hypothetical protein